ncbi:MAG: hypothetical protein ACXVCF_11265, partial [Isosphaeraceae bacterium]
GGQSLGKPLPDLSRQGQSLCEGPFSVSCRKSKPFKPSDAVGFDEKSPGHPSGPCRGALLFGSSIEIEVATYEKTKADSSASGGEGDGGISRVERAGPRPLR